MYFFLVITLIGVLGLLLLMRVIADYQPNERKVKADLQKMRDEIAQYGGELAPIDKQELDLFAVEQVQRTLKKRAVLTAKGVFTTIYHEPVAAYSYKRYVSSKLNALLYVRTAEREFVYRFKGKEVQIILNKQPLGTIKENGVLYSAQDGSMLARINSETAGLLPVVSKDRELGSISARNLPATAKPGLQSRAFEFVNDNLNDQEETLFMSIALMELVKRSVG
ncbi:MAG: hypothetical protein KAX50_01060 [Saprospiraceae bacterium]|nr:hypothetical protein [Saprospiraceae bacterium]